ncbi:MAG: hypothetical protein CK431_10260 [Mycobacterium sp.]|nr:MAG: hypothetical protein CK431_10260 [Mycobacterium sp.]
MTAAVAPPPWRERVRTAQEIADSLVGTGDRDEVFATTLHMLGFRIADPTAMACAVRDELDVGMTPAEIAARLTTHYMSKESATWFVAAAVAVFLPWREPAELQEVATA